MESYSFTDKRRFDLIALNTYLGGGMSSRLFQIIREKYGLAYTVYSFLDFYVDSGVFGFYLGAEQAKANMAIDLLREELTRVKNKILNNTVIKNLKEQLKGSYLLGLESTGRRMSRIAKNEIYFKRNITDEDVIEQINSISMESIQSCAKKLFCDEYINILKFIPSSQAAA
jgi:predicted Zn-dependent peptidase